MTKYFTNNFSVINLYKKPSVKSEIVTQMIYGDSFSIYKKSKKWLKIKIKEDNYKGYILNKKYSNFLKPTHKVNTLKAKIFKFPNKMKKNDSVTPSKNTPMLSSITNSDQLSHKQFVFPRCLSLGSRRHYHYLSHLPFDDLDSTLENYTQLTNNSNYTPDFNTTTDSTLERLQPVFDKLDL